MFGSFLPSLRSSSNHSLLGSRSRHCYAIMWNTGTTESAMYQIKRFGTCEKGTLISIGINELARRWKQPFDTSLEKDLPAQKPSKSATRNRLKTQCVSSSYLSAQKHMPAQPVDATPSNQLIRQCFRRRIDLLASIPSKPSQGSVPADLT